MIESVILIIDIVVLICLGIEYCRIQKNLKRVDELIETMEKDLQRIIESELDKIIDEP